MPDKKESYYYSLTIEELVYRSGHDAQPGSPVHEQIKNALNAKLVKSLVETIDNHRVSSDNLSNRILQLNIILGIFTVAGFILGLITLFI